VADRKGDFASSSLPRHVARGVVGFGSIAGGLALLPVVGVTSLLLLPVGLVALRGCPMCWTMGLIQTISAGRLRRNCGETGCELHWDRKGESGVVEEAGDPGSEPRLAAIRDHAAEGYLPVLRRPSARGEQEADRVHRDVAVGTARPRVANRADLSPMDLDADGDAAAHVEADGGVQLRGPLAMHGARHELGEH
jgi:hypothetical protein